MDEDTPSLTPQMQALLDACNVVVNKMHEESTYGQTHRVREYVDSLIDHTMARYPLIMKDDERTQSMRDELTNIILLHFAMKETN